ncbi:MAG TPA: DUF5632 domain-containing protein [Mycobacterium sp.]|nr:DUF5632 domain-containing protein [Mycobacterium sp.]HTX97951.1 DUF5632 domain-containing protein [Mycobacterium sp.]
MPIFGRITARQRLRRATRESLAIPAFSSPIDCTPWVIGGLWPTELSTTTAETASLAGSLKADLQRIADCANDELKMIKRAGLADPARQAKEVRVVEEARACAVRRVESTIRHLHAVNAGHPGPRVAESPHRDIDKTQVIPAVTEVRRAVNAQAEGAPPQPRWKVVDRRRAHVAAGESAAEIEHPESGGHQELTDDDAAAAKAQMEQTQVIPAVDEVEPVFDAQAETVSQPRWEPVEDGRHHAAPEPAAGERGLEAARDKHRRDDDTAPAGAGLHLRNGIAKTPSDGDRLNRLLEFVVRQEPRLNWAVGDRVDGSTVLVTDLAHGWIPSGITLPAGVRLLEPERRTGSAATMAGDTTRVVTYSPGDSLRRSIGFVATRSSVQPRELPAIADLARVLSDAVGRRDGLPRIVQRLADAVATGTRAIDQEVDVLRVHLDMARYRLFVQYPALNPALLLNCLLMAATESIASEDPISANYHLAWYQKLVEATPGQ